MIRLIVALLPFIICAQTIELYRSSFKYNIFNLEEIIFLDIIDIYNKKYGAELKTKINFMTPLIIFKPL